MKPSLISACLIAAVALSVTQPCFASTDPSDASDLSEFAVLSTIAIPIVIAGEGASAAVDTMHKVGLPNFGGWLH